MQVNTLNTGVDVKSVRDNLLNQVFKEERSGTKILVVAIHDNPDFSFICFTFTNNLFLRVESIM